MAYGYWGYDSRVLRIWLTGTEDMTHGYCISSWVLRIWLTGTDDMIHGYCISSRVLRIWLTGNAYPHGYWGYDSQVLMIWLMGNAYPHEYCIPSRVLHIVYTGWGTACLATHQHKICQMYILVLLCYDWNEYSGNNSYCLKWSTLFKSIWFVLKPLKGHWSGLPSTGHNFF